MSEKASQGEEQHGQRQGGENNRGPIWGSVKTPCSHQENKAEEGRRSSVPLFRQGQVRDGRGMRLQEE